MLLHNACLAIKIDFNWRESGLKLKQHLQDLCSCFNLDHVVFILDDNSEIGAQVWSNIDT